MTTPPLTDADFGTPVEGDGSPRPLLAQEVSRGADVAALVRVEDFIYLSPDVSNSYLVTTDDGAVVINAGTPSGGPRHRARYDELGAGPLRYLVLTQSHTDHIGGWAAFADSGARLVAHSSLPDVRGYWERLSEFYTRRSDRLWARTVGPRSPDHQRQFRVTPDIVFDDSYSFEVGGRRFELLSVPGGETLDSLLVWLPDERIVFTGNMFGPLYMHIPNLYTIRGDKIRSALGFVRSVERVLDLEPEVLITGHGDPIRGAERIGADLARLRDAVQYIHDETVAGMNAGKDVLTLMREIRLPDHLSLGEGHGKVSWDVRSVWEEYAGWFHYDTTTALYDVPPAAVAGDIVELAGGAGPLVARAAEHVSAGRPLEALRLLEVVEGAGDSSAEATTVKLGALRALLERSRGENLSEVMWLTAEITEAEQLLSEAMIHGHRG